MNDLVNNGGMIKPFPVDAFIDTRFAASLYSNEHEHVIVGVNLEHTKLFTYSMLLPTEHARAFRIAVSAKHESGSVGTCVYEVDANKGKKIAAMCSIQNERSPTLVIGFDTGEIIMGTVNDDQFDITMSLTKKIPSYFKRMQLLPTSTGLLLAHDPVYKIMRIWDMKKREHVEHFVEFVNLPAMHNLSISSDGKYLVGLDGKEAGNSDVIHCFKLPSFTQHKLKLQTPVEAFAVCQEGMVLVAMNSSHIDIAGTTILNIGTLDVLLKKSHEPIPLDKEQNKPAPEKAQHIGAFDAVKLLFHKDSKPSRDGDSDRRRLSK